MKYSRYNFTFQDKGNHYIYNSLSNSLIELDEESINSLKSNDFQLIDDESLNYLKDIMVLSSDETEKEALDDLKLTSYLTRYQQSGMNLTIAPTLYCNFDCPYCYEQSRPKLFMDEDTENKLLSFIEDRNSKKNLFITWYGGEPLLNFKRVKSISTKILEKDIPLSSSMITNGYLLSKEKSKELENLKIDSLQITMDGMENTHNNRRKHIRGKNTFRKILENIDSLFEVTNKVMVAIRVNLDKTNANEFLELDNYIKERYKKEKIYVGPAFVSDLGQNPCNNHCIFDRKERVEFSLKHKHLNSIQLYPEEKMTDCMARNVNAYVVDPMGGLYKCYNDIGMKEREIANLHTKGVNTALLTRYLVGEDAFSDTDCIPCKLFPICNGGCPHQRLKKASDPQLKKDLCLDIKGNETEFLLAHLERVEKYCSSECNNCSNSIK